MTFQDKAKEILKQAVVTKPSPRLQLVDDVIIYHSGNALAQLTAAHQEAASIIILEDQEYELASYGPPFSDGSRQATLRLKKAMDDNPADEDKDLVFMEYGNYSGPPNQTDPLDEGLYQIITDAMFGATGKGTAINKPMVDAVFVAINAEIAKAVREARVDELHRFAHVTAGVLDADECMRLLAKYTTERQVKLKEGGE